MEWHYHVEWFGPESDIDRIRESLDDLGEHGYELVSLAPHTFDGLGTGLVAVLKLLVAKALERD